MICATVDTDVIAAERILREHKAAFEEERMMICATVDTDVIAAERILREHKAAFEELAK